MGLSLKPIGTARQGIHAVALMAAALTLLACRVSKARVPASHGTAILAWENFPLSLDPLQGQDQASQQLLGLTHQGLVKRGTNLELVPDACVAWRWSNPYSELAFEFPKGLETYGRPLFPDGRPVRAEDAQKSILALMDPGLSSSKAGTFRDEIAELKIEQRGNSEQLLIRLKTADPGFAANLARGILGITQNGGVGAGTGAFAIQEIVPEQRILLKAKPGHPDFKGHPGPSLDLDLRWMPDATSRLLALRHGSVDACPNNLPPDLLRSPEGFEVHRRPGANLEYVAFNCTTPVLRDARVRRALSLALDRRALVQALMGGMAREASGFFPPELPFGAESDQGTEAGGLSARLRVAARLLDDAGFRKNAMGLRFRLRMHATADVASRMKALAIQSQWAPLGVELKISTREFGTLLSEVSTGCFEVASLRWVGIAEPEMLFNTFHSSRVPPSGFNRGHFADAETDRLLETARAAGDEAQRCALLKRVQARLVREAPYAFLWWPDQVVSAAPGIDLHLNPIGDFEGVWRRK